MSSTLQATKRRISSINGTIKITKAMELVAAAKLKKLNTALERIQNYTDLIRQTIFDIGSKITEVESPFLRPRQAGRSLVIVITSDFGLCGGYNINVLKKSSEIIKKDDIIYVIGSKGEHFFASSNNEVMKSEQHQLFTMNDARDLTKKIINLFLDNKVTEVLIIHTRFANSLTFEATKTTLLPFAILEENKNNFPDEIKCEPNPEVVLNQLIPHCLQAIIYGLILESEVSENASRRLAMENATDNAEDLIEELRIEFNKARQAAITSEITEIVAGAQTT